MTGLASPPAPLAFFIPVCAVCADSLLASCVLSSLQLRGAAPKRRAAEQHREIWSPMLLLRQEEQEEEEDSSSCGLPP